MVTARVSASAGNPKTTWPGASVDAPFQMPGIIPDRPVLDAAHWAQYGGSVPTSSNKGTQFQQQRSNEAPTRLRVFSGTANPVRKRSWLCPCMHASCILPVPSQTLAQEVAHYLGLELGKMKTKR